jgi:hypothetical protein
MAQIAILTPTVVAATANQAVAHGLDRIPTQVFIAKFQNPAVERLAVQVTAATADEAHAHALGVVPDMVILDLESSDLVTVGAAADAANVHLTNVSPANNKPAVVHLAAFNNWVTIGATPTDATNIYLTNAHALNDEQVTVYAMCSHSIIT